MSHQSLKSLVSYLVDISVISQDKQSTVYNFVQKRLVKYGVTSVSYEISDTQSILFSRDAITGLYSVEIITAAAVQESIQPAVAVPVPAVQSILSSSSQPTIQLVLDLVYEIDELKAAAYFKQHKKPRKLKLVDNTPSPQLTFNFDSPAKKTNVINLTHIFREARLFESKNVA